MMSYTRVVFAALLSTLVVGCVAGGRHPSATISIDQETLLAGPPELAAPDPEVDILAMDDEMRAYIAAHIPRDAHNSQKAKLLLQTFFSDDGIQVQYDNIKTHTAIETFHTRQGNCLSFTALFIAMAREVGLRASFQEVKTPTVWSSIGQLYIYNRHINVLLRYSNSNDQVVDFDMANFSDEYPRRRISDKAAVAQYHNNMSVYWLWQEDASRALAHQRMALKLLPHEDYLWTNLGAVYSHFGYPDYAEAAFLTALSYDMHDLVALSNLARLYERRGDEELARHYSEQVQYFRRNNPFYLYALAERHYEDGEYVEAREELRRAIKVQEGEHEFHQLLGLTELRLGDVEQARKNFELAHEYAREDRDRTRYSRKLQLLTGTKSE
jgi:Flp pilus assembly protein TadD